MLIVEDDTDVRSYLSDVLRDLQYRVLGAADGEAALALMAQDRLRIDLLLTDIVMPGMNGRELCKKAHELRPHLKVLYMTGYPRNAIDHNGGLVKASIFCRSRFHRRNWRIEFGICSTERSKLLGNRSDIGTKRTNRAPTYVCF